MTPNFWQHKNFLSYCLTPLSFIYRIVISIRRLLFKYKIKKTTHFNVPVIVVGNITVGGTGKTPLVIWLVNFLKRQGYKPGIVSRGYGGKNICYPGVVTAKSAVAQVGDEAKLIVRHTNCPMVVDPNRVRAVQKLLADYDCNVVISDDGLQHYALGRDIEIAVLDGARKFGNGFCLPAGPLREPVSRLSKVDFVVMNGADKKNSTLCYINMRLIHDQFYQIVNSTHTQPADYFKNQTIHAVAGIGNPQRFFNSLREMGLTIIEHPFPDHYSFKAENFAFDKDAVIIMTEKDAVKCESFADERFWFLPVQAELPEDFGGRILDKLGQSMFPAFR